MAQLRETKVADRALMSKPFAGVRILDFTAIWPGPTAPTSSRCSAPTSSRSSRASGDDMRRGPPTKEWAERKMRARRSWP